MIVKDPPSIKELGFLLLKVMRDKAEDILCEVIVDDSFSTLERVDIDFLAVGTEADRLGGVDQSIKVIEWIFWFWIMRKLIPHSIKMSF